MKTLLFIPIILISLSSLSQSNSLIGQWKVIGVDNGDVFYNSKTDSISFPSGELKELYNTPSNIKTLVELLKFTYLSNEYIFDENGYCIQKLAPSNTVKLKYENDEQRSVLKFHENNSMGEKVLTEMPYKLSNGLLYLTVTYSEPHGLYILEKIK